ncbi:MAG: hypothetical protein K0U64_00560 [Actinomycetia bacterium]|nr:hypothetical protein [Actinomycetes bacterium]
MIVIATVMVWIAALKEAAVQRVTARAEPEAGFGTLEWVLITLFVLGAATAAVAIVGTAITNRTQQIS